MEIQDLHCKTKNVSNRNVNTKLQKGRPGHANITQYSHPTQWHLEITMFSCISPGTWRGGRTPDLRIKIIKKWYVIARWKWFIFCLHALECLIKPQKKTTGFDWIGVLVLCLRPPSNQWISQVTPKKKTTPSVCPILSLCINIKNKSPSSKHWIAQVNPNNDPLFVRFIVSLQQTFYENTRLKTNNDPPSAQIFPDKDNAQNLI